MLRYPGGLSPRRNRGLLLLTTLGGYAERHSCAKSHICSKSKQICKTAHLHGSDSEASGSGGHSYEDAPLAVIRLVMLTRYFNSFKVEKTPWSSTPTAMPDADAAAPEAIEVPVRDTDAMHNYRAAGHTSSMRGATLEPADRSLTLPNTEQTTDSSRGSGGSLGISGGEAVDADNGNTGDSQRGGTASGGSTGQGGNTGQQASSGSSGSGQGDAPRGDGGAAGAGDDEDPDGRQSNGQGTPLPADLL